MANTILNRWESLFCFSCLNQGQKIDVLFIPSIFLHLCTYILTSSTKKFCKFAAWGRAGATLNTLRSYWAAYDNWRLTQRWYKWIRWGWMYDDFDVWPKPQETFLRMIISTFWRRKFRSRERHLSIFISLLDLLDNFCTTFDLVGHSLSIFIFSDGTTDGLNFCSPFIPIEIHYVIINEIVYKL